MLLLTMRLPCGGLAGQQKNRCETTTEQVEGGERTPSFELSDDDGA